MSSLWSASRSGPAAVLAFAGAVVRRGPLGFDRGVRVLRGGRASSRVLGRAGLSHVRSIARGPRDPAPPISRRAGRSRSACRSARANRSSTATLVRWIGWDGLGSRTVTVPSGVDTSSEPPGPIVSAPAAVTGPALKRMTFGSVERRARRSHAELLVERLDRHRLDRRAVDRDGHDRRIARAGDVDARLRPGRIDVGQLDAGQDAVRLSRAAPDEVDAVEREIERVRGQAVPLDVGPADDDAIRPAERERRAADPPRP